MSEQVNERKEISLFLLEDDPETLDHLQDIVTRIAESMTVTTVCSARTLADVEYFLEVAPGINTFTHLLFDLDVEFYKRRRNGQTIRYGDDHTGYAGLDYILDAYDNIEGFREKMDAGHVAMFTGHAVEFLEDHGNTGKAVHRNSRYISKLDRDVVGEILKWLEAE